MAERAGHSHARQVIVGVNRRLEADDRIHLQQRDRRRRALEIDLLEEPGRQDVRVHLQPDLQRGCRIHALLDDFMQPQLVGPHRFVAEGVEAKHPLALGDAGVWICRLTWTVRYGGARGGCVGLRRSTPRECDGRDHDRCETSFDCHPRHAPCFAVELAAHELVRYTRFPACNYRSLANGRFRRGNRDSRLMMVPTSQALFRVWPAGA
jgi:hypothetical protein